MANNILSANSTGINSVNSIYGVNSYKNYLSSLASRQSSPMSSVLSSAVAATVSANARTGNSQSSSYSYLTQLNNSINSIYMANAALSFGNKKVASTSSTISGIAQANASVKNYTVNVMNLATSQVNKGLELASNNKSIFDKGMNTIKIKSGGTERNVSFFINENDTNKSALNKLSASINKSNTGIKASVETGSNDKVYLKLESTKTGARNSFSLFDQQGNAATAAGLEKAETKAQDAVYSVDGRKYESPGNAASLDNGKVQLTLKKADNKEIELSVTSDTASSNLPDFYTYFNNLLSSGNYYNTGLGGGSILDVLL